MARYEDFWVSLSSQQCWHHWFFFFPPIEGSHHGAVFSAKAICGMWWGTITSMPRWVMWYLFIGSWFPTKMLSPMSLAAQMWVYSFLQRCHTWAEAQSVPILHAPAPQGKGNPWFRAFSAESNVGVGWRWQSTFQKSKRKYGDLWFTPL